MHGVQRLQLEGGVNQDMLEHPEAINWGLSEVSLVRAEASADGLNSRCSGRASATSSSTPVQRMSQDQRTSSGWPRTHPSVA